jgi:hypothetical protein
LLIILFVYEFADVCLDERAESSRVTAHLNAAQALASVVADNFWADRSRAQVFSLLQDRVAQAGVLAETCRSDLVVIHKVMFPLNYQPDGLPTLLEWFENGEAMYQFVHRHLHCGVQVALSFARVHYPEVDMELVKTLPPTPSGRTDMSSHYATSHRAAKYIAA